MATERRDAKVLGVRLSARELDMVDALTERCGLTASDVVRLLLRKEYDAVVGPIPKPKAARKGR